jgi:hypothetical protein
MITADSLQRFLVELIAYSGGAAAIAYLMFQNLGKNWIESKFAQKLEQLRHQQALELQRLRVEIDSLLSGTIKLQEREFAVLPEAWAKLDEAHSLVAWLVSPMQQYADVARMNPAQLEEFLAGTEFSSTQKDEVRSAADKSKTYQDIVFWHRLSKAKKAFGDLQTFIARNGIFLPKELEQHFANISEQLWSAVVSKEVGHEARDWKMQTEGWKGIKEKTEPLYKIIEVEIQKRLQSHGTKS